MRHTWNAVFLCFMSFFVATHTFGENQSQTVSSPEPSAQPKQSPQSSGFMKGHLMTCARSFLVPAAVTVASISLINQSIVIKSQRAVIQAARDVVDERDGVIERQNEKIDAQMDHIEDLAEINRNLREMVGVPSDQDDLVFSKSVAASSAELTKAMEAARDSNLNMVGQGAEQVRSLREKMVEHQKDLILNLLISVVTNSPDGSIKSFRDFIEKTELSGEDKSSLVEKGLFDGRLYWRVTLDVSGGRFIFGVKPPIEFDDEGDQVSI